MHILFVDDNKDTRDLFSLGFRMANHTIRLAIDGMEALALVESEVFDVIVLDLQMPVLGGWQTLWRIRQLPHGQKVPIALFSAYADDADMARVQEEGADALIFKPASPSAVLMILEELVKEHREKQAS